MLPSPDLDNIEMPVICLLFLGWLDWLEWLLFKLQSVWCQWAKNVWGDTLNSFTFFEKRNLINFMIPASSKHLNISAQMGLHFGCGVYNWFVTNFQTFKTVVVVLLSGLFSQFIQAEEVRHRTGPMSNKLANTRGSTRATRALVKRLHFVASLSLWMEMNEWMNGSTSGPTKRS